MSGWWVLLWKLVGLFALAQGMMLGSQSDGWVLYAACWAGATILLGHIVSTYAPEEDTE